MSGKHLQNRSEGFNSRWLHHKFSTITQAVFKQLRVKLKRRQALQKFVSRRGMIGTSLLLKQSFFQASLEKTDHDDQNVTLNSCVNTKKINILNLSYK